MSVRPAAPTASRPNARDPATDRALEALLAEAAAALQAGDPGAAASAVARALDALARSPAPAEPSRLLEVQARLLALAERERDRLGAELAGLGQSRRAAGAYAGGR